MKYIEYDVVDFVLDENFKRWVLSPDASNCAYWEAWLLAHPEKRETVSQARHIILMMRFKKDHPENKDFQTVWDAIDKAVSQSENEDVPQAKVVQLRSHKPNTPQNRFNYKVVMSWLGVAASILLAWFIYVQFFQCVTVSTQYGEMKKVVLPDQSVVTLNAYSEVVYEPSWDHETREVWLKGEAFFSVTHLQNDAPFIVHTDHLDVRVLGTEFNVNEREDKTQVVLSSGKVKVDLQDAPVVEKLVELVPGELLDYSHKDKKVVKTKTDVDKEIAWRDNQLIYDDVTIADVIGDVERQFGLKIKVEEAYILQHKFSGIIPTTSAEAFFITIENTFDVQVIRNGKHITIQSKQ